ncbi:hypothetical protein CHKEEEPN_0754 [Methylorubrum podarium]|nr:hypothetical protein CHKEEEPN_0754 [Methylorubrum podarium]
MWARSGNSVTDSISLRTSPRVSGWRNTGRPKVASVMNTSQGTTSKGRQVGSGARL